MKISFVNCSEEEQFYGEWTEEGFVFTDLFFELDYVRQMYVLFHETAHFLCGHGNHNEEFYLLLEKMLVGFDWKDWEIAREIEQVYPATWNR